MRKPACVRQRKWTLCSFFVQCSVLNLEYMVRDYDDILNISLIHALEREEKPMLSAVGLSFFFSKSVPQWNVPDCHHLLSHSTSQWAETPCADSERFVWINSYSGLQWRSRYLRIKRSDTLKKRKLYIDWPAAEQLRGASKPRVTHLKFN